MRIKFSIIILLIPAVCAFIFNISSNTTGYLYEPVLTTQAPAYDESNGGSFLIGSLNDGELTNLSYAADSLGFNLWHKYCGNEKINGKWYPAGWVNAGAPDDKIFSAHDVSADEVQKILSNVDRYKMKALIHRPRIEYLCYGQRSDYQCEPVALNNNYWFYAFNEHGTGIPATDSGSGVIYCRAGGSGHNRDSPGMVVSRLRANTEQSHSSTDEDAYRWDSQCDWLIKPRIRIDSMFARTNRETPVYSIKVINQDGQTLKETVIKAKYFLDANGNYNGCYKEEFNFFGETNLTVHGAWGDKWWFNARGTVDAAQEQANKDINHADIQVYWYGSCDMRIDYVRVDNDIADKLFKGYYDDPVHHPESPWLQWEAQEIACGKYSSPYQFYIDLFEFNQIPCISYLSRRLDDIYFSCSGKHINIMGDPLCYYQSHLNWNERGIIDTPEKIKQMYIDSIRANQIFLGDPYPIIARAPEGCSGSTLVNNVLPSTLNTSNDTILANIIASPSDYDAWLQGQLDTSNSFYEGGWDNRNHFAGVFRYLMTHGDRISKLCNIPFIAMLQAHQWVGAGGEIDREPTNEELSLMTNLAVSYGARGIIYWGFGSFRETPCKYCLGIMNGSTPRYINLYSQPKWEALKEMTARLKIWGPALMSFNNSDRQSYIYRYDDERNLCNTNTYFRWIVTEKPGTLQDVCPEWLQGIPAPPREQGFVYDCKQNTYLQAAVFRNSEPNTLYFMIVNRRCSPYYAKGINSRFPDGENGGRRKVKILFDTDNPQMSYANQWKITDISSGGNITFNKTSNQYVDLGWFNPGEGKLYIMVPAE